MRIEISHVDNVDDMQRFYYLLVTAISKGYLLCPLCGTWKLDVLDLPSNVEAYRKANASACCGDCRGNLETKYAGYIAFLESIRQEQDAGVWRSLPWWRQGGTRDENGNRTTYKKKNVVGYCYVVRYPQDTNVYKIGVTASRLRDRLYALNSAMKLEHEFVCAILCQDVFSLEATLHKRFEKDKKHKFGEYYTLTSEDLDLIHNIRYFDGIPVSHMTDVDMCTEARLLIAIEVDSVEW